MKLLGTTTSPFTRKVRILARAAQVPLELVDTRTQAGLDRLAEVSPLAKIPVLDTELDGLVLPDSALICSWLWTRHEAALRAAGVVLDPLDWEDRVRQEMVEGALDAAINRMYLRRDGFEEKGYLAKQAARVRTILAWLDPRVTFARPLKGSTLSLGCFLDWALFRQVVDLEPHPGLRAFYAAWKASGFGDETEPKE